MIFTTAQFVLFFVLFSAVFFPARGRPRKFVLLGASYLFYGSWDPRFLLLLMGSTVLDFLVGRLVHASVDEQTRRRWVLVSVVGNLGVLGVFKYYDFFVESAIEGLTALGVGADAPTLQVVLPVGISFYTFQTLSYTIDVYRRRIEPTRSLLDFANFVAFFPQLVAGPIERASHLLPQLTKVGSSDLRADYSGFGMIALGAFKKVVIADHMAPMVEATYADPHVTWPLAMWLGTYAFAVQIYCDFSGYSDIAVGLGRLMGIDVMQNFRAPYAATGPRELWRRWHISLSSWLRDYLYISLGGNRRGGKRTVFNLAATMLLGGLWHGAAWTYVLWGGLHGALLIAARWVRGVKVWERIPRVLRRLLFFHVVCLGWAAFRAQSPGHAAVALRKLLSPWTWNFPRWLHAIELSGDGRYLAFMAAVMAAVVVVQWIHPQGSNKAVARLWRAPVAVRVWTVVALLVACVLLAPEERPPFLYFQF